MTIRIQGVVRAARRARERLRDGIPEGERSAFLEDAVETVRRIRELCDEEGAGPGDLPAPSQRAFAELEEIARLTPQDLPAPEAGGPPQRGLRVSNVVAALEAILDELATTPSDGVGLDALLRRARHVVGSVDAVCTQNDTRPAALPPRTRNAYAMLAWLSKRGNAELYLDRRDTATRALDTALDEQGVPDDAGRDLRTRFVLGRSLLARRARADHVELRFHVGFLAAGDDDLRDAALVLVHRKRVPEPVLRRYHEFAESEGFGAMEQEVLVLAGGADYRPRGRVHDLDTLFDRVNATLFGGSQSRPHLHWHDGLSRVRFGFYSHARDLVCLEGRLDSERAPEFVVEFVLYHELLHRVHLPEQRGSRRHVHTEAFREAERRHPRFREAERWLGAFVQGKGRTRQR